MSGGVKLRTQGHRAHASMAMRFITRVGVSWRVWVLYGKLDCGQIYFNDSDYGGEKAALVEAKHHRDDLVRTHKIVLREFDGNGFHLTHSQNKTGMVGVVLSLDTRDRRTGAYWMASVMKDGKQVHVRRSIRRYGYVQAWRIVIKVREKHTGLKAPLQPPPPTEDLLELATKWGGLKE